jgi:hypothetical protein
MDSLFESNIVRNTSLGAMALWQFALSFYKQQAKIAGPSLPAMMLALPMVFHEATVNAIAGRTRDGALLKALAADRTITVGLQRRMQGYADRTFRALNLASAAGLLTLDKPSGPTVIPLLTAQPFRYASVEGQKILRAADRLGHSVALSGFETCCSLLSVRF